MKKQTRKTDASLAAKYLSQPYSRILIPQEGGRFSAEILEFPGCFAEGGSPAETYFNLERAAKDWILACLESKKPVPEPLTDYESSGKYALRLPRSLYARAAKAAAKDGTSLNQYLVTAVAERLGESSSSEKLLARLESLLTRNSVAPLSSESEVTAVSGDSKQVVTARILMMHGTSPAIN